jgi:hypothetical protein
MASTTFCGSQRLRRRDLVAGVARGMVEKRRVVRSGHDRADMDALDAVLLDLLPQRIRQAND